MHLEYIRAVRVKIQANSVAGGFKLLFFKPESRSESKLETKTVSGTEFEILLWRLYKHTYVQRLLFQNSNLTKIWHSLREVCPTQGLFRLVLVQVFVSKLQQGCPSCSVLLGFYTQMPASSVLINSLQWKRAGNSFDSSSPISVNCVFFTNNVPCMWQWVQVCQVFSHQSALLVRCVYMYMVLLQ